VNAPFHFTLQAIEDLDAIWSFIAGESPDAADRVEMEIVATCRRAGETSFDGKQAARYHAPAVALLDHHEISQLCDRLPA
jgi:plasmid stabilization system protein ParE